MYNVFYFHYSNADAKQSERCVYVKFSNSKSKFCLLTVIVINFIHETILITRGTAMAEGLRDAFVSRNSATMF